MKVTQKQKQVIQNYLDYYYQKNKDTKHELSFKNQMQNLYDHLTHIVD